jgi:hypothetical protein
MNAINRNEGTDIRANLPRKLARLKLRWEALPSLSRKWRVSLNLVARHKDKSRLSLRGKFA